MISLDFGPVTTSPLRKCCECSDLGGLVLVQETQLGSLPLQRFLNLTTSFPQKMHRFAASSRLDYLLNPFLILIAHQSNCTQAFFFRRWICSSHLCVMPDRKPEKGLEKNAECTRCVCARATFLGLQRFGTPSQPGRQAPLWQPAKLLSTLCESTTWQPARTDPDARTHSHPQEENLEAELNPYSVLTAFLSPPGASGSDLARASHHLKLV